MNKEIFKKNPSYSALITLKSYTSQDASAENKSYPEFCHLLIIAFELFYRKNDLKYIQLLFIAATDQWTRSESCPRIVNSL